MILNLKFIMQQRRACTAFTTLIIMTAGTLWGCSSSSPPRYYSLAPTMIPGTVNPNKVRIIEVLPVGLSDRLNRIPLVLQQENGQSRVLYEQRWTSTLAAELRDGLSAGLQQKLGAIDRYNSGMTGGKAAYRIATDFAHFDLIEQQGRPQRVLATASWTVRLDDPNRPLSSPKNAQTLPASQQLNCRFDLQQPVHGQQQLQDAVDSARQALQQITHAVAESVLALEQKHSVRGTGYICS